MITAQFLKVGTLALALFMGSASASTLQTADNKVPFKADKDQTLPGMYLRNLISGTKGMKKTAQPTRAKEDIEMLLEEDFSGFTAALADSVNVTSGVAQGDPFINPTYFNGQEGWWGNGVYSASGAAGLVHPNFGGILTTPNMTLYGNIHVSFKIKLQEGNTSSVLVFISLGHGMDRMPAMIGYNYVMYSPSDSEQGWMDVDVTVPSTYTGDDAWVQINGANYLKTGVLIDDLKISRDLNICGTPTDVWTYDYMRDGFSATWVPGAENKSFLVNLVGQTPVSYDLEWHSGNFKQNEIPEGWLINNTEFVDLPDGEVGIEMGAGSMVELPANYASISDLTFNLSVPAANEESTLVFGIEGKDGSRWMNLGQLYVYEMQEGNEYSINLSELVYWFSDSFKDVRLYVEDLGYGDSTKVVLSDIKWSTNGWYDKFIAADNMEVKENNIVFSDLDMESLYFLSISGVNEDLVSLPTNEIQAIGVAAPDVLAATDIDFDKGRYTANWEAEPKADYGYNVSNFMMREVEEDNPEYIVMADHFADAEGNNTEDVQNWEGDFNGISDNPGWTTEPGYGIINDNMIGTWYGGVLTSPYLTLDNNDGEYTVYFTLMGWGQAELVVQNGIEYQKARLNGEFDMMTGTYDQDEITVFMTFKNGRRHDRLEFYTLDGSSFLIGDFQVIQGVKKGDKIYEHESTEFVGPGVTSYTFTGLVAPEGFVYDYAVQGVRFVEEDFWTGLTVTKVSNMSEDVIVDTKDGVKNVGDSESIDRNAPLEVYTTSGIKVADKTDNLPSGLYIVRQAGKSVKITVK